MNLRTKILLALAILFSSYVFVDYTIQHRIVYPSFVELERNEAITDIERCAMGISREIEHLSVLCWDWSAWDDTRDFVLDHNEEYADSNFTDTTFSDTPLNLVYVVDNDGAVVWGEAYEVDDDDELIPMDLEGFSDGEFTGNHQMLEHETPESEMSGLLMTKHGPMLIASRPIVNSESEGPIHGTLIMGRFLGDDSIEMLAEQTRVNFDARPIQGSLPEDYRAALSRMSSEETIIVEESGEDLLAVFTTFVDLEGNPALLLHANVPREITARGTAAMRTAAASLIGAGIVTLVVLVLLLQGLVIGPVAKLTNHAVAIGTDGTMTKAIDVRRSDELGTLATEFNRMMQNLEDTRSQFMDASRRAGMAEVASGVLHNVGNALNSVAVSTSVIRDQVHKSKLSGLPKAVALMREHTDDLADFITEDERGRQLPVYLDQLAETYKVEQEAMVSEIDRLNESIGHIKDVVNVQQSFTGSTSVSEPSSPITLIEKALTVSAGSIERHQITLVRDWNDNLPEIDVDRSKFVQMTVNLLMNAKDAVLGLEPAQRIVTVRVKLVGAEQIQIEINDQGMGIDPAHVDRIFSQGFTTKDGGHGYGLHYCAQTAKELGGSLAAQSNGPGQGASFVLELPVKSAEPRIAG